MAAIVIFSPRQRIKTITRLTDNKTMNNKTLNQVTRDRKELSDCASLYF